MNLRSQAFQDTTLPTDVSKDSIVFICNGQGDQ